MLELFVRSGSGWFLGSRDSVWDLVQGGPLDRRQDTHNGFRYSHILTIRSIRLGAWTVVYPNPV